MDSASQAIQATAIYDSSSAAAVLGLGEDKLSELVNDRQLRPMNVGFKRAKWLFFGEELIRFCRSATGLPDYDYTVELATATPDSPKEAP